MASQNIIDSAVTRIVDVAHPVKVILFGSYGRDDATENSGVTLLAASPIISIDFTKDKTSIRS